MSGLDASVSWPADRIEEALEAAAAHLELRASPSRMPLAHGRGRSSIDRAAARIGVGAEPTASSYGDLEERLLGYAPAIVRVGVAERRDLVIVGARRDELDVLAPDLGVRRVGVDAVARALCAALETPLLPEIDRMLAEAAVPDARRGPARRALLHQRLRARRVEGIVRLRPLDGASFASELRRSGVVRRLAVFLGAHAAHYLAWLVAWSVVGSAALSGRFDRGVLLGWLLLLVSSIPLRLLATWSQGAFAVEAGRILKRRLLDAALRLDPQSVRGEGIGSFVGRVIEAEAVESLALSGGAAALTSATELLVAGIILAIAAGSPVLALALLAWTALTVLLGASCLRRRGAWTRARLDLTHDLVEKMVGHRTRLVQTTNETRHAGEDAEIDDYVAVSGRMDAATARLFALAPRGWLLAGSVGCGIAFVAAPPSTTETAIALGGVLLAYQALTRFAHGLSDLGGAVIAWREIAAWLCAPSASTEPTPYALASDETSPAATGVELPARVLEVRELAFTHPGRTEPVLLGVNLDVFEGDRILLEGASGSGKSTLASLLSGLRSPDAGVVLLRGVDRRAVGAETWHRRVATSPQFHENHVLTETFAFNVLLGRGWPPRAGDVEAAEALCAELGLSDLLSRMPAGMYEMVGESGWRLSHGEQSRVFMARALLQESEVVVLDESFAALDPGSLEAALRCALLRTKTLVMIAHP